MIDAIKEWTFKFKVNDDREFPVKVDKIEYDEIAMQFHVKIPAQEYIIVDEETWTHPKWCDKNPYE